jgi:hypothetical protein
MVLSKGEIHTAFRGTTDITAKTKLQQMKPETFGGCFRTQTVLTWRSPSCSTSCRPSQSRCKFRPGTDDTPHTWGKRRATPDQAPLSRYTGRGSALHTPHRDSAAAFLQNRVPSFSVSLLPASFVELTCYTLFKKWKSNFRNPARSSWLHVEYPVVGAQLCSTSLWQLRIF